MSEHNLNYAKSRQLVSPVLMSGIKPLNFKNNTTRASRTGDLIWLILGMATTLTSWVSIMRSQFAYVVKILDLSHNTGA